MSDLYDADILSWSEHQVASLRRAAAGEPANEAPDWTNIIEKVESVGRDQLQAVASLLTLALLHDLKAEAWPLSDAVPHWRAEARTFRNEARRRATTSMRSRLDLAEPYADALDGLPETVDGGGTDWARNRRAFALAVWRTARAGLTDDLH